MILTGIAGNICVLFTANDAYMRDLKIIERDGAKVAAYRDASGAVTLRSATCTHMGCIVAWNTAEKTWDCPCHGSRFEPSGDVISGPAEAPLSKVE